MDLVKDVESKTLLLTNPNNTLDVTINVTVEKGVSYLPLVESLNPKQLVGFITKGDILRTHHKKRFIEAMQVHFNIKNSRPKNKNWRKYSENLIKSLKSYIIKPIQDLTFIFH